MGIGRNQNLNQTDMTINLFHCLMLFEHLDLLKFYVLEVFQMIKNFVKKKILEVGAGNGEIIDNYVNDNSNKIILLISSLNN